MDDILEPIAAGVATLLLIVYMGVFILWGLLLVALAWAIISAGIAWIEHQRLLRQAQDAFDKVRDRNIPQVQIDPLLRAIFGDIDLPSAGASNEDWLSEALFGVS